MSTFIYLYKRKTVHKQRFLPFTTQNHNKKYYFYKVRLADDLELADE